MMLDRLRVLESAATLAPWIAGESGSVWTDGWERQVFSHGPLSSTDPNAELVAAARNALPALLAVADAVDGLLRAADAAPIPLSSATAMRWDDLCRAFARLEVERAPLGGDA